MKKLILFLALIGFLAGTAHASIVLSHTAKMTQITLNDDPPKAKDTKDSKVGETTKTACCDKGTIKKSCCDDKKPTDKSCCDKGPKENCKPGSNPKK